ncbi:MAG: hypothetical protein MUF00_13285 [Gemmatimonadaceae bacterium]|jgi:hypothetical protein|nr:hypothetical protein [Gemmatimonadaceae bacterium]
MLVACGPAETPSPSDSALPAPPSAGVIDSALPIAEHLRRFRATLSERPDTLRHAAASVDQLVRRWIAAMAARDTTTLRALVIDRAEFAQLIYEQMRIAQPPYEMAPALLWFQISERSELGIRKSLEQLGGRPVTLRSLRCPTPVDTQGMLRMHDGCLLRLRVAGDTLPEMRYFGSIVERYGRHKFVGYSNDL